MIDKREVLAIAQQTSLTPHAVGKDYANFLKGAFSEIGEWIYDQTGIEIPADKQEYDIYENPRGQFSCQGKISYKGPVSSTHALPRIKLGLTADERIVLPPVHVQIFHP